jgi:Domain of Unknown Function with PDB structure (DUF3857)/Transglutaminase-like superfamily
MSAMLKTCLTGLFLFLQIYLSAQDKIENYVKGEISPSLTKDADAVCRLEEYDVEVKSPGKIIVRERHVYSVLNENADKLSNYNTHYNKLTSINYVDGILFNSSGKELKHFKKKDMSDVARDGDAFVSDDRMKIDGFNYNTYPYTVAYEEEDEEAGAMYIPGWYPPRTNKMSVELSRYVLTVPIDYKFRYKMVNTAIQPVIAEKKDKITYTWEIRNLPVIPEEPFSVSPELYDPFMLVGPTSFELQGYTGNMADWNEYGKFYASLQKGRDVLPDDLKKQVHELTDPISDPSKKVALLYDYLQKNTHYVLIQFGIGGLQTYEASYVAKNKYGDCKALTNFMISLLKEAGIKGYPVIIKGDEYEGEFYPDFPSHQFNHVICAVPNAKDTIWLECTDQYLPAGYLGVFTANRYGLMINDNGGTLVHTPVYSLKDNISVRKMSGTIDPEGNLQVKSETYYRALSQDPYERLSHHLSRDQQLEYLKRNLSLPTYTINTFNYKEDYSARLPAMQETLDISIANYAHFTGRRIFVNPNVLRRSETKFSDDKDRVLDFQFKTEFIETDSVEITIPTGYEPEALHKDLLLETKYGRFITQEKIVADKIKYYRHFEQFRGRYPASSYDEIKTFYNSVYDADHTQMVLIRKN